VGAGPASLAAAGYLALEGVEVTLYEKRALAGGLNATGVAPYKMHAEGAELEVDFIRSLGVTIRTGVEVGKDVSPADLLREYDAVFIGVGLGADSQLGLPGEDGAGVVGATAWIERMKLEPGFTVGEVRRAVVVGGGNTAIDAARELIRLGVPSVAIAYRRTAAEMPGYRHELDQALREGMRLVEQAVPKAFRREATGRLAALQLQNGQELAADLVVLAIGQARLGALAASFEGVTVDPRGLVAADRATGATANPKVYVGGDALNGGELVVTAAQEGKRAARAIARALGLKIRVDAPMGAGHP
jgi:glutamate synthase (NADPH/NADH) small chain